MLYDTEDRVQMASTSTGTGTMTLFYVGANSTVELSNYKSIISGVPEGVKTFYSITDGTDWEIGVGSWSGSAILTGESPYILTREEVHESSNFNSFVNFLNGRKNISLAKRNWSIISDKK